MIRSPKKEHVSWMVSFCILRDLRFLPRPICVAKSEACDESYKNPGTARADDMHGAVFQYTLKGMGHLRAGNTTFEVPEGKGFLCRVGDPHIEYYYPSSGGGVWRFLFLSFVETGNLVESVNKELGYVFDVHPRNSMIRHLLEYGEMRERVFEMSAGDGALMIHRLLSALVDIARYPDADSSRPLRLIRQAHRLIDQQQVVGSTPSAGSILSFLFPMFYVSDASLICAC
ncbi:MAG: hypothetical protein K9N51_06690 [Candidatus Pacebacteria bacterium]|nr:hypothetical protein [Candidatus Paceibacterota bacterium]